MVPRPVWAAVGVLSLTTAAMGGALVQRSLVHADTAAAPTVASRLQSQQPVFDGPEPNGQPPVTSAPAAAATSASRGTHVDAPRLAQAPAAPCTVCGTVESVRAVRVKGQSSGIGVVGGALAGGLLGHQLGGGSGKTALTIAGAAGGALAGREVERNARATTVYDLRVRMQDGSVRSLRRSTPLAAGTPVRVEGTRLRVAGGSSRVA